MTKMLTKHGNSYALVIDKPILELLHATPTTPFEIMTDGRCLFITPVRERIEEERFRQALDRVHRRYGSTLKKLAE